MDEKMALRLALDCLRTNWFGEDVGVVSAVIVEGMYSICATSRYLPETKRWLHAEAAALQIFEELFERKPGPGSMIVVTLSPCLRKSCSREGESCTHRIQESGISRVRYGCLDTKQAEDNAVYTDLGLDSSLIEDPFMQKTCGSLYRLFGDIYRMDGRLSHLAELENPWPEAKRLLGLEPFKV